MMLKPLTLIFLAILPSSESYTSSLIKSYSVDQFVGDCRKAGGTPQIFLNSVACENASGQTITCLRTQKYVNACKLEAQL